MEVLGPAFPSTHWSLWTSLVLLGLSVLLNKSKTQTQGLTALMDSDLPLCESEVRSSSSCGAASFCHESCPCAGFSLAKGGNLL